MTNYYITVTNTYYVTGVETSGEVMSDLSEAIAFAENLNAKEAR